MIARREFISLLGGAARGRSRRARSSSLPLVTLTLGPPNRAPTLGRIPARPE